jgi:lysozyme family protein
MSVRNISLAEAKEIYRIQYWDVCRCDDMPAGVDWMLFDAAVNSGPVQSAKWLQRAINDTIFGTNYGKIDDDGHIGLITDERCNDAYFHDAKALLGSMMAKRLGMLHTLKTWLTFGKGWTNRVNLVHKQAVDMIQLDTMFPRIPHVSFEPFKLSMMERVWNWIQDLFI